MLDDHIDAFVTLGRCWVFLVLVKLQSPVSLHAPSLHAHTKGDRKHQFDTNDKHDQIFGGRWRQLSILLNSKASPSKGNSVILS